MDIADVERQLKESYPFSYGDSFINPVSQFFDGRNLFSPTFTSFDQRISANYLYITESQLSLLRSYCRWLYDTNISAKNALPALAKYVVAGGFTYTVAAKKNKTVSDEDLEAIQQVIDDFIEKNDWNTLEADIFNRTHRDGDSFIHVVRQEDKVSAARIIGPEWVQSPFTLGLGEHVEGSEIEWKFGVRTVAPDTQTPVSYCISYVQPDNSRGVKIIPADELIHIKVNVDYGMKRGISDFFSLQDVLINCQKLLDASLRGEMARQAIALIRQWQMASAQTITTLQTSNTTYTQQIPNPNGTGTSQPVQQFQPGMQLDIPDGMEMMGPPIGNSSNAVALLNASYQQLAAWWCVPQWLVSGSSDATNYAASLTSESPMIKNVETRQKFYARHFKRVMKRVLTIAIDDGLLDQELVDSIQIEIEAESAHVRDAATETTTNETLYRNKVMSKKTWQLKENLDPDVEDALIAMEPPPEQDGQENGENPDESTTPAAKYKQQGE